MKGLANYLPSFLTLKPTTYQTHSPVRLWLQVYKVNTETGSSAFRYTVPLNNLLKNTEAENFCVRTM